MERDNIIKDDIIKTINKKHLSNYQRLKKLIEEFSVDWK